MKNKTENHVNIMMNIESIKKVAEQGDIKEQYKLGVCYWNGLGAKQDYKEAVFWYRKAADQGDADAQYKLGINYYKGKNVKQDYKEAVTWFRKAADQGYANAQYGLGICYDQGKGVEQNYEEAIVWYRKAAEQGYIEAQQNFKSLLDKIKKEKDDKDEIATKEYELCSVCLENKKCMAFQPCGHIATCVSCSKKIKSECPLCKTYIQSKFRVYI